MELQLTGVDGMSFVESLRLYLFGALFGATIFAIGERHALLERWVEKIWIKFRSKFWTEKPKEKIRRAGKVTILRRRGKMISFDSVTKAGKFVGRSQEYLFYLDKTKRAEPNTGYKVEIVRK